MGNVCTCDQREGETLEYNILPLNFKKSNLSVLPKTYHLPTFFQKKLKELQALSPPKNIEKYDFDQNYYELPDKSIYQGTWDKEGRGSGYGKIIYLEKGYYEGGIECFQPKGKGRYITISNDVYEGDFNGMKQIEGSLSTSEGVVVKGTFYEFVIDGHGEEVWKDGTTFQGVYNNGQKNGFGKMAWYDDDMKVIETYEGEFVDNKFHGKGLYNWINKKKKYDGEWKDGKMNGKGEFNWKDGRGYKGEFKDDSREGYGEFRWYDGRMWKGNWKNGEKVGIGYLIDSSGVQQVGEWKDDKRVRWLSKEELHEFEKKNGKK